MQRFIILGRIGKDLEIKKTQAGKSVLEFSVADTKKINDQQVTTWTNWVAWEGKAEAIAKYSRKGDVIYLEGEYKNEEYKDKEGNKKYRSYFVASSFAFVPNKREEKEPEDTSKFGGQGIDTSNLDINPEDIPFY